MSRSWGIVAGVAPSLMSMFTPRFLTPVYFVAPLFLVAPVALIARWSPKLSWLSFAVLPVCLLPVSPWTASPWLQGAALEQEMGVVEIQVPEAIQLWYALEQEFPDADICVMTAPDLGLLALQGREGTLSGGDPRFMTTDAAPPRDDQFILTAEAAPPPGQRLAGRFQRSTTCEPCRGRYIARQMMYDDLMVQLYEPVGGR